MLKRNRKLNKQTLIESSLEYGDLKQGGKYWHYPVFEWLYRANGIATAIAMLQDAQRFEVHFSETCDYPAGCVIWTDTAYYREWKAADDLYMSENAT